MSQLRTQAHLFRDLIEDTSVLQSSEDDAWAASLTQRLKTLLLTSPIHRLEAARNQYGDEMSAFDLRAAALRVLDAAIENMGLGAGATRAVIVAAVEPVIRKSETNATADRILIVGNRIIDAMLNDREQRSEFEEPYLDLQDDEPRWLAHRFRLLREEELADGSIVIRATTEGINLYLGMLEFDVASAQIATEAVLHEQIRRGHIDKAVTTAQQARYRSIQFEAELQETLRAVRRDISQVDWVRDVLPKLDEARERIQGRLSTEGELIEIVSQRLDQANPEDIPHLVRLLDTIRDCQQRHLRLNEKVIPANSLFLDEQARQGFRIVIPASVVHTESEVLYPALELQARTLAERIDSILCPFHAPHTPPPLDLAQLATRLLAPRREEAIAEYEVAVPELEETVLSEPPFSQEDVTAARHLLDVTVPDEGILLSELLTAVRERGLAAVAEDCLVLTVMRAFDPLGRESEGSPGENVVALRATPTGGRLSDERYFGDELLIARGDSNDIA